MSNRVVNPGRSAVLITEALRVGFRLAGSRASGAEVSTAVGAEAFTVAEVAGNSVSYLERNLRNGERNHEHEESDH